MKSLIFYALEIEIPPLANWNSKFNTQHNVFFKLSRK